MKIIVVHEVYIQFDPINNLITCQGLDGGSTFRGTKEDAEKFAKSDNLTFAGVQDGSLVWN